MNTSNETHKKSTTITGKITRVFFLFTTIHTLFGCTPEKVETQQALAEALKLQALTNTIQSLEKEKSQLKEEFESLCENLQHEISALKATNRLVTISFQDELSQLKSDYESEINLLKSSTPPK